MAVRHYRELLVWQKSMDFTIAIYHATESFPKSETYRLCDQLRRAAISIPSNIAEGQGRRSTRDFLKHLSYSVGSLHEAETQILLSTRLQYFTATTEDSLLSAAAEIGRMLSGLVAALEKRMSDTPPS